MESMEPSPLFLAPDAKADPIALYLDMVKRSLLNWIYPEVEEKLGKPFDPAKRTEGISWPPTAHTMVGLRRLNHLQTCVETILRDDIPGDLLEAGVWRGGASILMKAVLRAHAVTDRNVWLADSFAGLPPPDALRYPHDANLDLYLADALKVSVAEVRQNFRKYGLELTEDKCLVGWFKDTLSAAPVNALSLLRLDGDLYESTMNVLDALYPKVSPGGFVVIDDYGAISACAEAVHDYRREHAIIEPLEPIDASGVFWRRGVRL